MTAITVPLKCRCGQVRGVARKVSPAEGFRFVCYCHDCRAFIHYLKREDVLDSAGGTDIFQMPVGSVELTAGKEAVRSVRLSNKGLFRWYADCCKTPMGNSIGRNFPMISLIHSFMDHEASGHTRDELLGPPLCRLFERSASGPLPPNAPLPPGPKLVIYRVYKLLSWKMQGLYRPNAFFDSVTRTPLSTPRVLTPTERAALS